MKADNKNSGVVDATTAASSFGSVVRRFFQSWKRWEDAMDYSAQDYALDRIKALELRVLQLENASSATGQLSPSAPQS